MTTFVTTEEISAWDPPAARPFDEAVWREWAARGCAPDRRSGAARISAMKWASIAALLAAAVFWFHLAPFEVVVRFLVSAGAMVVLFQALQARYLRLERLRCSQPGGARIQFFKRLATRRSGDKRRTVRSVSPMAR